MSYQKYNIKSFPRLIINDNLIKQSTNNNRSYKIYKCINKSTIILYKLKLIFYNTSKNKKTLENYYLTLNFFINYLKFIL